MSPRPRRNVSLVRVLTILRQFEGGRRLTMQGCATAFQVHPRTIRRDFELLEEVGVPLTHQHEYHGGHEIAIWWMAR